MELYILLQAILLGIVEGMTEFLPVSSTGHLIIFGEIMSFKSPPGKVFEVVIQLGSILAVCWLYRRKLLRIAFSIHRSKQSQIFTLNILLAFIPSVILGVMLHSTIKEHLFNPVVVSSMLVVGGFIMILAERICMKRMKYHDVDEIPPHTALKIGFFQTVAMIPGVSRSGATIIGALLMGVDRKTAAEFSFFLAIPTMFAATFYDIYKNYDVLSLEDSGIIAAGFISAFISALFVVKIAINFISKHGFMPFAIYRIIVGCLMLVYFTLVI